MSDSPQWMPLNVGDYLKDTGHLTVTEHGAYLLLIMRYWQDGGLPANEKLIQRYSQLSAEQWTESRDVLADLFDEGWKHKRIDAELAKAADIIGKRKSAAHQRHSTCNASAEQVDSISSYAGVPPLPEPRPEEDKSPAPVLGASGARDFFDEIFKAFPRNPQSSEGDAYRAFKAIGSAEHGSVLAAAQRYAKWFAEDCARRKRSPEAGVDFVPKLSTWLANGAWREASSLPIKAESTGPVVAMERIDQMVDPKLFAECERIRGKKSPISPWSFRAEIVDSARQALKSMAAA